MLPGLGLQRALALLGLAAALRPRSNLSAAHWSHLHPANMLSSCKVDRLYHSKALTSPYPGSRVERSRVPEDKVGWLTQWEGYNPVEYTAAAVLAGPKWADPQINDKNFTPKFNERDGEVERTSRNGLYVVENGRPRNPTGRTGLTGRGLLGRWGPNHAADPIVTRWKRDGSGNKIAHPVTGKNILQFVAIKRRDCGEWAIPGGMVDPGEKISATLKREFGEEALNSLQKSPEEKASLEKQLQRLFSQEHFVVYRGYVDDPRNTDNAWMETEAVNYHDETENTSPEQTYFRGGSQITTSGADALRRGTFSGVCSRFSRSSLLFPVLPISSVTHDSILYIVLTQLAERSK